MTGDPAAVVLARLVAQRRTLATAESLTGGGLGAVLTSVPGASEVYVGGVISYATRVKVEVLQVPPALVEEHGVVSAECARAMAQGVRRVLRSDVGVATTGVAGPDAQEDKEPGIVYVAVADDEGEDVSELHLTGDRAEIRGAATLRALELVGHRIGAFG